ncbi:MAG: ankyrin repeat domain-containing protein [Synergistaceae bacterium]|jgi:ankyrin repeat protein|nr:ankyrin repeat domain-containing protein [Synergistaceae bacterium]
MKRTFSAVAFLGAVILVVVVSTPTPSTANDEAFFQMVLNDDVEGVKAAIEKGQNVNARDKITGRTPLFFVSGDARVAEALIRAGADVNAMSEDTTALSVAAVLGKAEDVSVLLKAGARLESAPGGLTSLHLATGIIAMKRKGMRGSFEERARQATSFFLMQGQEFRPDFLGTVKLLAEAGADIDAKTQSGDLLKKTFEFSIEAGDVDYRQFENKTPLELARIVGNEEVAKYLSEVSPSR